MSFFLQGARVLVASNDDVDFLLVQRFFAESGENVVMEHAQNYDQAISCMASGAYDAILLDHDLRENREADLLDTIRAHGPDTPIIVLIRQGDAQGAASAIQNGAAGVLVKSRITPELAGTVIRQAIDAKHQPAEWHRTTEALRESEEKFSKIFDANPLPTTVTRIKDGCCIDANAALVEMTGRPREQIVGQSILDVAFWITPEQRTEFIERLRAGERVRDEEIEFSAAQGKILRGQISMELIEIAGDLCYISIIRDVTGQKQTEQALIESNEKLRAIVEASPAAITALDPAGIVQIWNPAAEKMYGWTASEVVGKKLPMVPEEDQLQFLAFRERLLQGENIEPFEATRKSKDGSVLHSLVSLAPLRHKDGVVFGTFSIHLNITRRKVAEEALRQSTLELQAAKETAEAATRAKSEFVANMSHEIRTPMNGILGMTELALNTELSPEQREFISLVKSSADSLMVIINDILDYSKIEAGKLTLDPVVFNLRDTLDDIVKIMGVSAQQKALALTCYVQPSVPLELVGDVCRLRQVILNLMGNAIKFTPQGEVSLSVSSGERSGQYAMLNFAVHDTGVGIPREKQDKIFQAFEQADSSTTRKYGGTGLGLAISTRIVHLMGGKIWVESVPGEGSTFHFTIQFTLVDHRSTVPAVTSHGDLRVFRASTGGANDTNDLVLNANDQHSHESLRVLLAEDNIVNQKLAATMIEKMGHTVVQAATGKEAVEKWEQNQFDLVFMDVQMPVMDGFEATQEIRSREKLTGAHVPIIAMTANTMSGDRERCLKSGMDDYVGKPVAIRELLRAIAKFGPPRVCQADSDMGTTTLERSAMNHGSLTD